MHYPTPDIYVEFEINRCVSYSATAFQRYFHRRRTDGQTDRRTDIVSDDIRYFFFVKKKATKNELATYHKLIHANLIERTYSHSGFSNYVVNVMIDRYGYECILYPWD